MIIKNMVKNSSGISYTPTRKKGGTGPPQRHHPGNSPLDALVSANQIGNHTNTCLEPGNPGRTSVRSARPTGVSARLFSGTSLIPVASGP